MQKIYLVILHFKADLSSNKSQPENEFPYGSNILNKHGKGCLLKKVMTKSW